MQCGGGDEGFPTKEVLACPNKEVHPKKKVRNVIRQGPACRTHRTGGHDVSETTVFY